MGDGIGRALERYRGVLLTGFDKLCHLVLMLTLTAARLTAVTLIAVTLTVATLTEAL